MTLSVVVCLLLVAMRTSAQVAISSAGPEQRSLKSPVTNTPPEKRSTVQGKVVNALTGEPIRKVSVRLVKNSDRTGRVEGEQAEGYSDNSTADGTFRIDGIEPGEYYLSGERPGFLNSTYGASISFGRGTKISLSPSQQLTGVTLGMTPQAVIAGRVIDQDGDPVGGMSLMALRQVWNRGKAQYFPFANEQTDEEGRFRLAGLQPGKYYLVVGKGFRGDMEAPPASPGKPDIRPIRTFYPNAMARDSATPINVRAGETASDIEIRMQFAAAHHIRGKLVGSLTTPIDQVRLELMPADSESFFPFGLGGNNNLKPDRTFDIAGVTPGRYWLSAMAFEGTLKLVCGSYVEMGDTDINGVELAPMQAGTLKGQIVLTAPPPAGTAAADLKKVRVFLQPTDVQRIFFGVQSETTDTGLVTIKNVYPGKYEVSVQNLPTGAYVQSVNYGNQDVFHQLLDLSGGAGGELQITLRYGVGEIDGTLVPQDNSPDANKKPNAIVFVIPENPDIHEYYQSEPDQNQAFSEKELPPGAYRVVAVEGLNPMSLGNPDLRKELASRGTEIELKENEKKRIQLPVVTAADVQQIMARLGIEGE
jgi:hypothetical protein